MAKPTLKALQEAFDAFKVKAQKYVRENTNPKGVVHSTVPTVTADKKLNMVSVAELISATKAAESLGYDTLLNIVNGGRELQIVFVEKRKFSYLD